MLIIAFAYLFILISSKSVSAHLSDILLTCADVSCDDPDDRAELNPDHNFEWIAAGLPHIFWKEVYSSSIFNQTVLSGRCKHQLVTISQALRQNKRWAYEFIDASGKTPAGLMKATVSAIGDYDQCLEIANNDNNDVILGKYCMIDMHPVLKISPADELVLHRMNAVVGYPFLSSLCIPSGCHASEIKESVKNLLLPYNIKVAGHMHCDTAEEISWMHKLSNLTLKQMISILFLATIFASVVLATTWDIYQRVMFQQAAKEQEPGLLKSLSLVSMSYHLFWSKPWSSYEIFTTDVVKTVIIFAGAMAHSFVCIEDLLSFAIIANHEFMINLFKSLGAQFLLNDTGLLGVTFITGMTTFSIAYPMCKKGNLHYFKATADRVIRFIPPISVLIACEFIWPILGSGPLYSRVGDFNLKNCNDNWFYDLFFVNNYFLYPLDICGIHTFYLSVDMQLFMQGLIVIFIFSRSVKVGVWISIAMIMFGTIKTAHSAIEYETAFSLVVADPIPHKIVEFFQYIHMQTPSYMAAYFTGFLISYARMNGHLYLKINGWRDHVKHLSIVLGAGWVMNMNSMMRNSFNVYPDHLNWLFITINRTFQLVNVSWMILYFTARGQKNVEAPTTGSAKREVNEGSKMEFNLMKALCRLSFPLYICNFLYIRSEFFTRRFLYPSGIFWIMKRLVSSFIFLLIFATLFQLLLLSPLDVLRDHITRSRRNKEQDSKSV